MMEAESQGRAFCRNLIGQKPSRPTETSREILLEFH